MKEQREYRFVIDAYSPDTLPMVRLAEYMGELARLLGRLDQVHFVRLEQRSTVLVQSVEPEAAPDVRERLHSLRQGNPPEDAARAFTALNRYLADDDATGILQVSGAAEVIRFPGREEPAPVTFGAFNQTGVLDGVLIRIGGRDETVPAHLRDGETIHVCNTTREMSKRLAIHLYGPPLRVHGDGRWERDADSRWVMKRFNITSFDELDDAPLGEVAQRLRDVEGSGWKEIEDPTAELRHLRVDRIVACEETGDSFAARAPKLRRDWRARRSMPDQGREGR